MTSKREEQDVYKITVDKANCFITVYYKQNGLTSISYQSPKKLQQLGQRCIDFIIDKSSLPDTLHKSFTIRDSKVEQYPFFKEAIKEVLSITEVEIKDKSVNERIQVADKSGATLTLTLYNNGTLFFQGRITPLFVTLIGFALEWMVKDESLKLENCIDLHNMVVAFDENPCAHIRNHTIFQNEAEILLRLIRTSLQLANSGIVVSDYSCYTFDILRSIEGLIKYRLLLDVPPFDDFGDFFEKDRRTNTYKFHATCTIYDSYPNLKRALEHSYTFFNSNRHSTFHVDEQLDTTRILDYSEAISIIEESLNLINEICDNWC